jgi:protein TonB
VEAMIRRASPVPAPPADIAGETVTLVIPIRFRLNFR